MGSAPLRKDLVAIFAAALLGGLVALALGLAPDAGAADAEKLKAKLAEARDQASAIRGEIGADAERVAAAEGEADGAEARERELSGLLAEGEERSERLRRAELAAGQRLEAERLRLRRARRALATRLVAIYESGVPSTAELVLAADDLDELATGADYLRAVTESDSDLAARVEQVRDAVRAETEEAERRHRRAVAHTGELAAARGEITGARAAAEEAAANLRAAAAERRSSLAGLRGRIDGWVTEIEEAKAASRPAAEAEVGRWLGGPYSIPTYIVICESGGNYSALNASSGAGGAYQIIPSTWDLYGGKGAPHEAPKAEQDRIAAEIWADSGGGAWVCA